MKWLLRNHPDRILLAVMLVALGVSVIWLRQQQAGVRRLRASMVAPQLSGTTYAPGDQPLPEAGMADWPPAPAQSAGRDWVYELFTPPGIFHDASARSFTAVPSRPLEGNDAGFGPELLGVKADPYPLQLTGYFGAPGNYVALFVSPPKSGTLLARPGHHFESLGLTLTAFEVRKVPVEHDDAWPVHDVMAFAVLHDERTGADVVLDSRARKLTGTPVAVMIRPLAPNGEQVAWTEFSDRAAGALATRGTP